MRRRVFVLALMVCAPLAGAAWQSAYRTLDDKFPPPRFASADEWTRRAAYLREHILASAGLLPMPERTPLRPVVFGEVKRTDYSVSKAYFESVPGFYVTGNLYRPAGDGPFPAIVSPHGHWPYGRLENSANASIPGRAINLARQGFVVFTYDMIGYNDSRQLTHAFGGRRENLWGLSLAGLQLWNSIRAVDFLETLPYVRRGAIGATGASGGGTQTFLLAAVDDRVAVAAPVNMISLHMQGGCLCENLPGLRLDTTNVEIAATIAPRPLLMVSATGDWTKNTLEVEFPAVKSLYALAGAADRVHAVRFQAEHNYNRDSREAVYAWMARWLQQAPADARRPERSFTPEPLPDVLVFHQRPLPEGALSAAQLTEQWISAAERQRTAAPADSLRRSLLHALGFGEQAPAGKAATNGSGQRLRQRAGRTVLLAATDPDLEGALKGAGATVRAIAFAPFDAAAAGKVHHFETYNRTPASQRVADIVAAARANPGAVLVADGDAALAGLLAAAVAPIGKAVLGIGRFDPSSDAEFLEKLYIPGLRRAGDLRTALAAATGEIVIHDAGDRFRVDDVKARAGKVRVEARKLSPREIAALLR